MSSDRTQNYSGSILITKVMMIHIHWVPTLKLWHLGYAQCHMLYCPTGHSSTTQTAGTITTAHSASRVPTPPGKYWIFFFKIPGPGKSWKNTLENYALRHFCSEFWRLRLFQISNFPGLCSGPHWGAYSAPPDPLAGGEGARCPLLKNPIPTIGLSGFFFYI